MRCLSFKDVKPSNILIDSKTGEIKLCDFGISGNLINSNAFSRNNAGCAGYMAPERIDPVDPQNPVYDIRADVWSLGITLVELATGEYPYKNCQNEFEVMSTILSLDSPRLSGEHFSPEFTAFVNRCLIKDVRQRPKYAALLADPFVAIYRDRHVDMRGWFERVVASQANDTSSNPPQLKTVTPPPPSQPPPPPPSLDSLHINSDDDGHRSSRSLTPTLNTTAAATTL